MNEPQQIVELGLGDFIEADALQIRTRLIDSQVRSLKALMEAGVELDPIEVARLTDKRHRAFRHPVTGITTQYGAGTLAVYHGFHRVRAARELGRDTIRAVITDMTFDEAYWRAAEANKRNGAPLRTADYRNIFNAFVKTGRHKLPGRRFKTYQQIQIEAGLPVTWYTVRLWMKQDFFPTFKAMGRGEDKRADGGLRDPPPPAPEVTATEKAIDHFRQGFHNATLAPLTEWHELRTLLDEGFQWFDRARAYNPEDRPPPPEWIASSTPEWDPAADTTATARGSYARHIVGLNVDRLARMTRTLEDICKASQANASPEEQAKLADAMRTIAGRLKVADCDRSKAAGSKAG